MKKVMAANMLALAMVLALAGCGKGGPRDMAGSAAADNIAETAYPENVYWGDTHLHTSNSIDAFGFGVRLGPEEALRFARGEQVTSTMGLQAKLDRPLDFLVIADHSDGLGATRRLYDAPRLLIRDPQLRKWHDMMVEGPEGSLRATAEIIDRAAAGTLPESMRNDENREKNTREIWTSHTEIVERYNEPGKFTAFMGFEYTLMPNGNNLHRVVMFRDGKDRADKVLPFGSTQTDAKVEQLWDYMDGYEKKTGGKMLAIPHNSNVSNGLMFELTGPDGGPMSAEYARKRAAHEPVVEATQIKGDSEAHPFMSPNDEFAGYGKTGWQLGNLTMQIPATDAMQAGSHVREALKRGLAIEARTGVNPYKYGMIGSTDSHTALSTGDESNFYGKHSGNEPDAKRAMAPQGLGTRIGRVGWHYLAGGYAAVWAKANTRAAIFDAMMRREVYATTGPRMKVRLFGGWDFATADLNGDWLKAGYQRGVPMGGDLKPSAKGAPTFLVSALKDPIGANLDRVQIIKGWIDKAGRTHEKIFDVVWSNMDKRQKGGNGKVSAVGDTVDVAKATYTNSIGAAELNTVWTDPEFNPDQKSFYYVRVLEIPTPRWVLYDAVRYGAKLAADVRVKDQERAYTSPIWYNPKG
jgi:predicted small lipoprotein YifL